MRTATTICTLIVLTAGMTGCASHTVPLHQPRKLTTAERNFQDLWEASLKVLRSYDFKIDRQDKRAGIITTLPMTGRHWFEFWRKDAVATGDVAEGTVQTVFRIAKVTIRPTAPNATTFQTFVRVEIQRSNRDTMQVTNTSEAFGLFKLSRGGEGRRMYLLDYGQGPQKLGLVPLGRDHALGDRIQSKILSAAGPAAWPAPSIKPKPAPTE